MTARLSEQRILIVEDQEGPCAALMMILRPFYQVESAETAAAALELVVQNPIDLVIMDVGLPDYSGIELLRRIRAAGGASSLLTMSCS